MCTGTRVVRDQTSPTGGALRPSPLAFGCPLVGACIAIYRFFHDLLLVTYGIRVMSGWRVMWLSILQFNSIQFPRVHTRTMNTITVSLAMPQLCCALCVRVYRRITLILTPQGGCQIRSIGFTRPSVRFLLCTIGIHRRATRDTHTSGLPVPQYHM